MYGMLSILGRHKRAPDREFEVVFSSMGKDFMTIDGRAFVGNTPVFRAKVGELVQWDVMAIGSDFHTFTSTGTAGSPPDGPRDTRTVGPAESFRVQWSRGRSGNLALPLPRRGSHDARDDRHLSGLEVIRRAAAGALAMLGLALPVHAASAATLRVKVEFQAFAPDTLDALRGDSVLWTSNSGRRHTVHAGRPRAVRFRRPVRRWTLLSYLRRHRHLELRTTAPCTEACSARST